MHLNYIRNYKEYLRLGYYTLQKCQHGREFHFTKVIILAPEYVKHIAEAIRLLVWGEGRECIITETYLEPEISCALYIVLCPQAFSRLPIKRIVYQFEQWPSRKYFSRSRLKMLSKSIAVLDYSKLNCEGLSGVVSFESLYYWLPVSPFESASKPGCERQYSYDLVFYGAMNKRRELILNSMDKNFKLNVIENLVGDDLIRSLNSAKYCLNIHYYDAALFEAVRFSQCLNYGIPMVSEVSNDQEDYYSFSKVLKFMEFCDAKIYIDSIEKLLMSNNISDIDIEAVRRESFIDFRANFNRIINLVGINLRKGTYSPNKGI